MLHGGSKKLYLGGTLSAVKKKGARVRTGRHCTSRTTIAVRSASPKAPIPTGLVSLHVGIRGLMCNKQQRGSS